MNQSFDSNCRIPHLMVYLLIELIWIFRKGGPNRKAESKKTGNAMKTETGKSK